MLPSTTTQTGVHCARAARTVASGLGRQILRGVLGGLLGGKR